MEYVFYLAVTHIIGELPKYINRCFVCKLHTSIRDSVRHLESTVIPLIFRNVKDSLFLLELCDLIVPDITLEMNN